MIKKQPFPRVRGFTFVRSREGIAEYTLLSNGLTVLLMEDKSAPIVGVDIHYKVGSRHEVPGNTGSTHLLEHMLFKGSKKFNKKNGTDMWTILEDTGTTTNATTWLDRTHYYEIGEKEHVPLYLEMEADRMRGALIDQRDLDREMTVVRNEYERGENDPQEALDKQVWATAFTASGYHHSTIGWREDIESTNAEKLRRFYDTYYYPNNAVLTVLGDISIKTTLALVARYFGHVPRSRSPFPDTTVKEPKQEGPRRTVVIRHGGEKIFMLAHKVPPAIHKDTPALWLLTDILGKGATSRLYKRLIDTGKATGLSVWSGAFHDESLMQTLVRFDKHGDEREIEGIVRDVYTGLAKNGVTTQEFTRSKKCLHAEKEMARDGIRGLLNALTTGISWGDWTYLFTGHEEMLKTRQKDVEAAAVNYLTERTETVGVFIPEA